MITIQIQYENYHIDYILFTKPYLLFCFFSIFAHIIRNSKGIAI
ncbi:hypothetical protein HMPREF1870_02438 [Bacteroidales bacterium KA00344]|nr:hypothetical protein HMPREF1870_02438 [Bacteroidales bacterium KA00344]